MLTINDDESDNRNEDEDALPKHRVATAYQFRPPMAQRQGRAAVQHDETGDDQALAEKRARLSATLSERSVPIFGEKVYGYGEQVNKD